MVSGRLNGNAGFTLIELMVALAVGAVLVTLAYAALSGFLRNGRLHEAQQALLTNVQALERHYAAHGHFKKNSTAWMDLPVTRTDAFCIKMQGNPRGTNSNDAFSMKAVAWDKTAEPRVLRVNQDLTVWVCERSSSSCDETDFFKNPGRSDRNCTLWK